MFENDEEMSYGINIDAIIESEYSEIVKSLAIQIKENPYITVGGYLQSLPQEDLDTLCDYVEDMHARNEAINNGEIEINEDDDIPESENELLLLTLMLSQSEAGSLTSLGEMTGALSAFGVLLICTSLYRRGLVETHFDKISLQADAGDNIVMEKKEGIDYDQYFGKEDD